MERGSNDDRATITRGIEKGFNTRFYRRCARIAEIDLLGHHKM